MMTVLIQGTDYNGPSPCKRLNDAVLSLKPAFATSPSGLLTNPGQGALHFPSTGAQVANSEDAVALVTLSQVVHVMYGSLDEYTVVG
jgi:hypothetical protein